MSARTDQWSYVAVALVAIVSAMLLSPPIELMEPNRLLIVTLATIAIVADGFAWSGIREIYILAEYAHGGEQSPIVTVEPEADDALDNQPRRSRWRRRSPAA